MSFIVYIVLLSSLKPGLRFALSASFNLDIFWLSHSPDNHIKHQSYGLYSLDPCAGICHSTAQPGKATYISWLLHLYFPVKPPNLDISWLHLAAHFGSFWLQPLLSFSFSVFLLLFAFSLWIIERQGSPLVFFPLSVQSLVLMLNWRSFV